MKHFKLKHLGLGLLLSMALTGCGDEGSSDCSGSNLSNRSVTFSLSGQSVTVAMSSSCSYTSSLCSERGTWTPVDSNTVRFNPTSSTCGALDTTTCNYVIVGSEIAFTCS